MRRGGGTWVAQDGTRREVSVRALHSTALAEPPTRAGYRGPHPTPDPSYPTPRAAAGFKKTIKQLDGRDIVVEHRGVTQPFEVRRIENEGMPNHNVPSQRGTMHVKYVVQLPKSLSAAQQAVIDANFS